MVGLLDQVAAEPQVLELLARYLVDITIDTLVHDELQGQGEPVQAPAAPRGRLDSQEFQLSGKDSLLFSLMRGCYRRT